MNIAKETDHLTPLHLWFNFLNLPKLSALSIYSLTSQLTVSKGKIGLELNKTHTKLKGPPEIAANTNNGSPIIYIMNTSAIYFIDRAQS
jgi:hypothetical protein